MKTTRDTAKSYWIAFGKRLSIWTFLFIVWALITDWVFRMNY